MPVMLMGEDAKFFTDGQAYERLMGRWSRIAAETFLHWLDAPKNLKWLDVGCGNGAFTEELIARCAPAAVSAIDPSDDQLAYARTRPGVKMTEFRVGDAEKLPFGDGTFDVAVMALVISFLRDPNKAAAEMARVVRPGGWVAAYMWDLPGGGAPTYPAQNWVGARQPHPLIPMPSKSETLVATGTARVTCSIRSSCKRCCCISASTARRQLRRSRGSSRRATSRFSAC